MTPQKKILLVEGRDDEHVVVHFCTARGIGKLDKIEDSKGVEKLVTGFPIRLKQSGIEVLGVVVDADTDLTSRWMALRTHLEKAGYLNLPGQPKPNGTIVQPPVDSLLPRVGIWLMPNNQTTGILEDFLTLLIPDGDELFEHSNRSIDSIPSNQRRFSEVARPKALIHTWLAWQAEPGKPLGISITARYLNPHHPRADQFVDWLRELFFPPGSIVV